MKLYDQIKEITDSNFVHGEADIDKLFFDFPLYYITENGNIYFLNEFLNDEIEHTITSFCFLDEKNEMLMLLATNNNFKGQGFAKRLLKVIVNSFKNSNLYVRVSNINAIKLYESLGFEKIKIVEKYYYYTSKNENAYMMKFKPITNFLKKYLNIPEF